ncbi:hypothetical protein GCM10010126_39030 [Planomonospora parontospora]|uniref:Uncharacterized protein n=2 Tax=Planomonospora parontospora TaxID=58119 RepID=A0AA37BIA2_9ACTN|nr:hypothetical protein [Planomonospora parontospora]GGK76004.1 hypothetical protein GCM10010126_39030 [Planomonospora parontospora]
MPEALFLALFVISLSSPVLGIAAVALVVHIVITMAWRETVPWGELGGAGLLGALAVYTSGMWSGGFFYASGYTDLCALERYDSAPRPSSTWWPLRHPVCQDESGRVVDLVPAFVNPVLHLGIALLVAGVAGAVVSRRRRARPGGEASR